MPPKKKGAAAKKKAGGGAASNGGASPTPVSVESTPSSEMNIDPGATTPPPESPSSPADPIKQAEKVKEQGNTAFKGGKFAEAIKLYTEAIELNPQEPAYLTNRAAAYMGLKRFTPALEDCQKALFILQSPSQSQSTSTTPSATAQAEAKTLLRLARCQYALGALPAALASLTRLTTLDPTSASKPTTPAMLLQTKVQTLQTHVKNFQSAYTSGDYPMARLSLDKCFGALTLEGGEPPVDWRVYRVELEVARASWDAAGVAANEAVRCASTSPDALAVRGWVLFLTGRLPQALQHVETALRYDPGHERAREVRRRVKDVDRVKEEGNRLFKTGDLAGAVEKYTECLERIGCEEAEGKGGLIRGTLLSNRATASLKMGELEGALQDVDEALRIAPGSFKALRTRARVYVGLEEWEKAIADFKSAISEAGGDSGQASEADVRALRAEMRKAEVDLKRSKTKDYYKILGVAKTCTEVEVKKAYRRESLKHHPDKGGDEEQFKLVSEAYAILSDSAKRQRYDMGEDDDGMMGGDDMHGHGMHGMSHMDLAELFAQFQGAGAGGRGGGRRGGGMGGMGGMGGFPF